MRQWPRTIDDEPDASVQLTVMCWCVLVCVGVCSCVFVCVRVCACVYMRICVKHPSTEPTSPTPQLPSSPAHRGLRGLISGEQRCRVILVTSSHLGDARNCIYRNCYLDAGDSCSASRPFCSGEQLNGLGYVRPRGKKRGVVRGGVYMYHP